MIEKMVLNFNPNNIVLSNTDSLTYTDFINKELIHFSNYDNVRSIPSLIDGLKPSHRKIFVCSFKRNLTKEIRVAQLAGYVSEHGAYHHGEASLHGAIIGMAQNFVGHNNINYLEPIGQFGSRLKGGKDSAQPRYIHTHLTKISNIIFNKLDNPILEHTEDDGIKVEPKYYLPIIPMILINGSEGIGTGWSTGIPKFNPIDVISNIKKLMNDQEPDDMIPWMKGFQGRVSKIVKNSWISKGNYSIIDTTTVVVTELPLGMWTDNYKALDKLMLGIEKETTKGKGKGKGKANTNNKRAKSAPVPKKELKFILRIIQMNALSLRIKFILKFDKGILSKLLNTIESNGLSKFESLFKLTSKISCDKKLVVYDETVSICFKEINDI